MTVTETTEWPLHGGCHCGRIRYRLLAEPISVGICHCSSCRRAAGATPIAWAVMKQASIVFDGEPATWSSSPGVTRGFCGVCGTTLTFRDNTESVDVTLATLDNPDALIPPREVWLEDRVDWAAVDRNRPCFGRRSIDGPQLDRDML